MTGTRSPVSGDIREEYEPLLTGDPMTTTPARIGGLTPVGAPMTTTPTSWTLGGAIARAKPHKRPLLFDPTGDTCPMSVTRRGELEPCGQPLTGWRLWWFNGGVGLSRACKRHARKKDGDLAAHIVRVEYGV